MAKPIRIQLTDRAQVLDQLSFSNTTLHERIKDKLIPPPISVGARGVRWIQSEIDSVLNAMVAGKTKSEIRELVNRLIDQRKNLALLEVLV